MSSNAKDLALAAGGAMCAITAAVLWWNGQEQSPKRTKNKHNSRASASESYLDRPDQTPSVGSIKPTLKPKETRSSKSSRSNSNATQNQALNTSDTNLNELPARTISSGSQSRVFDAIGGHGSKKNKGPPILVKDDGKIYKPFQAAKQDGIKSRGEVEAEFYQRVNRDQHPIIEHIPRCYGIEHPGEGEDCEYLALENLQWGMKHPCVLDLKMGTQTYDENASPEKIAKEKAKYPPQTEIGFRIVGMKVYLGQTKETFMSKRAWCMSLQPSEMKGAIERYFFDGFCLRLELVRKVLEAVRQIRTMLLAKPTWRMYGSSLLMIYDGEPSSPPRLQVKMIDFAHVFPIKDGGVDDGYLHGLEFLMNVLESILEGESNDAAEQKSMVLGGTVAGAVGGHGNVGKGEVGQVLKWEDDKEHFDTELAFYEKAKEINDPLTAFMPKLLQVIPANEVNGKRAMVLTDATSLVLPKSAWNQGQASVMDVKLGMRSFQQDCSNRPIERYFEKYALFEQTLSPGKTQETWTKILNGDRNGPRCLTNGCLGKKDYLSFRDGTTTSADHGFRLTALSDNNYQVTQAKSRSLQTLHEFLECYERFLSDGKDGFNTKRAENYLSALDELLKAFENSEHLAINYDLIGTSLLFVHCKDKVAIRWIDFANSKVLETKVKGDLPAEGGNGILHGIRTLQSVTMDLIAKHSDVPESLYF